MTIEIVSAVIGAIGTYIINKISYNKKMKDYRKAFMSPYKMELLKLSTYLERTTYIVVSRRELSMDKKQVACMPQLLEELENLEELNIKNISHESELRTRAYS